MAISEESYARGNPVYGTGSSAPTRGTVDPSGYIERSLNAPSQQRSGLAQAALERLNGSAPSATGGGFTAPASPGVTPLGDVKSLTISPTGQMIPSNGLPTPVPAAPVTPPLGVGSAPAGNPLAAAALSRLLASGGLQNGS